MKRIEVSSERDDAKRLARSASISGNVNEYSRIYSRNQTDESTSHKQKNSKENKAIPVYISSDRKGYNRRGLHSSKDGNSSKEDPSIKEANSIKEHHSSMEDYSSIDDSISTTSSLPQFKDLMIKHIPEWISNSDLHYGLLSEFEKYGSVSIKLRKQLIHRCAKICFEYPEDAKRAWESIKQHPLLLDDKKVKVVPWLNRSAYTTKDPSDTFSHYDPTPHTNSQPDAMPHTYSQPDSMPHTYSQPDSMPHTYNRPHLIPHTCSQPRVIPQHDATKRGAQSENSDGQYQSRVLYVGNISRDITKDALRKVFQTFGEIESIYVHPKKCLAYIVKFRNIASARVAKAEMHNNYIGHSLCKIGFEKLDASILKKKDTFSTSSEGIKSESTKLWTDLLISNIPNHVTSKELKSMLRAKFASFDINNINIQTKYCGNISRAIINFNDHYTAKAAYIHNQFLSLNDGRDVVGCMPIYVSHKSEQEKKPDDQTICDTKETDKKVFLSSDRTDDEIRGEKSGSLEYDQISISDDDTEPNIGSEEAKCDETKKTIMSLPLNVDDKCIAETYKKSIEPVEQQLDDTATSNLFVGNLPPGISENELHALFEKYGKIESVIIRQPQNNRTYAFVKYISIGYAQKAEVDVNGQMFKDHRLTIAYSKSQVTSCLCVEGLGSWVDISTLKKEFGNFGEIKKFVWPKESSFANVQYEDDATAQAACHTMNFFSIGAGNKQLRVDFVSENNVTELEEKEKDTEYHQETDVDQFEEKKIDLTDERETYANEPMTDTINDPQIEAEITKTINDAQIEVDELKEAKMTDTVNDPQIEAKMTMTVNDTQIDVNAPEEAKMSDVNDPQREANKLEEVTTITISDAQIETSEAEEAKMTDTVYDPQTETTEPEEAMIITMNDAQLESNEAEVNKKIDNTDDPEIYTDELEVKERKDTTDDPEKDTNRDEDTEKGANRHKEWKMIDNTSNRETNTNRHEGWITIEITDDSEKDVGEHKEWKMLDNTNNPEKDTTDGSEKDANKHKEWKMVDTKDGPEKETNEPEELKMIDTTNDPEKDVNRYEELKAIDTMDGPEKETIKPEERTKIDTDDPEKDLKEWKMINTTDDSEKDANWHEEKKMIDMNDPEIETNKQIDLTDSAEKHVSMYVELKTNVATDDPKNKSNEHEELKVIDTGDNTEKEINEKKGWEKFDNADNPNKDTNEQKEWRKTDDSEKDAIQTEEKKNIHTKNDLKNNVGGHEDRKTANINDNPEKETNESEEKKKFGASDDPKKETDDPGKKKKFDTTGDPKQDADEVALENKTALSDVSDRSFISFVSSRSLSPGEPKRGKLLTRSSSIHSDISDKSFISFISSGSLSPSINNRGKPTRLASVHSKISDDDVSSSLRSNIWAPFSPVKESSESSGYVPSHKRRKYDYQKHEREYSSDRYERDYSPNRHRIDYSSDRHRREYSSDRHRREYSPDRHRREYSPDRHRIGYSSDRHRIGYSSDRHRREYSSDRHRREYSSDRHQREFSSDGWDSSSSSYYYGGSRKRDNLCSRDQKYSRHDSYQYRKRRRDSMERQDSNSYRTNSIERDRKSYSYHKRHRETSSERYSRRSSSDYSDKSKYRDSEHRRNSRNNSPRLQSVRESTSYSAGRSFQSHPNYSALSNSFLDFERSFQGGSGDLSESVTQNTGYQKTVSSSQNVVPERSYQSTNPFNVFSNQGNVPKGAFNPGNYAGRPPMVQYPVYQQNTSPFNGNVSNSISSPSVNMNVPSTLNPVQSSFVPTGRSSQAVGSTNRGHLLLSQAIQRIVPSPQTSFNNNSVSYTGQNVQANHPQGLYSMTSQPPRAPSNTKDPGASPWQIRQ